MENGTSRGWKTPSRGPIGNMSDGRNQKSPPRRRKTNEMQTEGIKRKVCRQVRLLEWIVNDLLLMRRWRRRRGEGEAEVTEKEKEV